jgi:murein DD-endopeptidase MepM/ murein hydrolase activator NlpD
LSALRSSFLLLACCVVASSSAAAQSRLIAVPTKADPGAVVRLTLQGWARRDSVRAVAGDMAGEPLHFVRADSGRWLAIGGVPVTAENAVGARAYVTLINGRVDTVRARVAVPPFVPPKTEPLTVDTGFTRLDSVAIARVARDNAKAREVGRRSHDTPRMWFEPFIKPRNSVMTSTFGTGRSFNTEVKSRHNGTDFRGKVGDTVFASNRGVVALTEDFLLAGTILYVDHGAGVVTGYFHLSRVLVAAGDTVERGQAVALVGASGRVTGSHLHWAARYGSLTVNGMDLVNLDQQWIRAR